MSEKNYDGENQAGHFKGPEEPARQFCPGVLARQVEQVQKKPDQENGALQAPRQEAGTEPLPVVAGRGNTW